MVPFREKINQEAGLTEEDLIPKVTIDVPMPIDYITEELIQELSCLEPFGKGNQKPVFAEKNLNVLSARILGKNKNVIKMQVLNQAGIVLDAMYFGGCGGVSGLSQGKYGTGETEKLFQNRENSVYLSVTYYPTINEYMNRKSIQIVVQNYQ